MAERAVRGELNASITSAMVGIHTEHLGRGPTSAFTFHHDNILVTLMHGVMTPAEQTLARGPRAEAVSSIRHLFQQEMASDYTAAVERITGLKVQAFISGQTLNPDVATEVFVLDRPL